MMLDFVSLFLESQHPQIYMHFLSPNPTPRFLNDLKANTNHMLENALLYCFLRVKKQFPYLIRRGFSIGETACQPSSRETKHPFCLFRRFTTRDADSE